MTVQLSIEQNVTRERQVPDEEAPCAVDGHVAGNHRYRGVFATAFSFIFIGMAFVLLGFAAWQFLDGLTGDKAFVTVIVHTINTTVIALAMYELGIGVGEEYAANGRGSDIFQAIRRAVTRFVGVVCIALVLEALIMVIKYSQLDLAGNLHYPVGILLGASALLIALGVFLRMSADAGEQEPQRAR